MIAIRQSDRLGKGSMVWGEGGIFGTMGVFNGCRIWWHWELAEGTKGLVIQLSKPNPTPPLPQVPVSNDLSGNNGRD